MITKLDISFPQSRCMHVSF